MRVCAKARADVAVYACACEAKCGGGGLTCRVEAFSCVCTLLVRAVVGSGWRRSRVRVRKYAPVRMFIVSGTRVHVSGVFVN